MYINHGDTVIEDHDSTAVTPLRVQMAVLECLSEDTIMVLLKLDIVFRRTVFPDKVINGKRIVINIGRKLAGIEYKWAHDKTFDMSLFALNDAIGKHMEDIKDLTINFSGTLTITKSNDVNKESDCLQPQIVTYPMEDDGELWRFGFWVDLK